MRALTQAADQQKDGPSQRPGHNFRVVVRLPVWRRQQTVHPLSGGVRELTPVNSQTGDRPRRLLESHQDDALLFSARGRPPRCKGSCGSPRMGELGAVAVDTERWTEDSVSRPNDPERSTKDSLSRPDNPERWTKNSLPRPDNPERWTEDSVSRPNDPERSTKDSLSRPDNPERWTEDSVSRPNDPERSTKDSLPRPDNPERWTRISVRATRKSERGPKRSDHAAKDLESGPRKSR